MKLLLLADVPNLGYFGDVVEVKNGYGRNYLLPQQLATMPTESKIQAIEEERAKRAEERRMAREALVKVADKVEGASVTIESNANASGHLYGSVTEADIAKALQDAVYEVQTKHVSLSHHITEIGSYDVTLKFAPDLSAAIKVNVVVPGGASDTASAEEVVESEPEVSETDAE